MEEKIQLMRNLIEKLNAASDAYYNGRGEAMSDYEWDAMFDSLKKLEQETGTVLPDSPTNNVSADSVAGQRRNTSFRHCRWQRLKSRKNSQNGPTDVRYGCRGNSTD